MNQNIEISRLLDLMPASGRMETKIIPKPEQSQVISYAMAKPWERGQKSIYINFDLWSTLHQTERDLALLTTVASLIRIRWFKWDWYQAIAGGGLITAGWEFTHGHGMGVIIGLSATTIAANQIWKKAVSPDRQVETDQAAMDIAIRRGYDQLTAAQALYDAIHAIAMIEHQGQLNFVDSLRCQKLKQIMGNKLGKRPVSIQNNPRL